MASDILTYRATHVPVGEDQKQHLELTRDIAQKFNNDYSGRIESLGLGEPMMVGNERVQGYFPLTEPLIGGPAARVMSLRDGAKKMSKSDPSDLSRIVMTDDSDTIAKKIRKAKTDPAPLPETIDDLKDRPEADNLVGIYAALADIDKSSVLTEFAGAQFGTFKPILVDLAVEKIGPIAREMRRLQADPAEIDAVLSRGSDKARAIASQTLADVKEIVGFVGARR